MSQPDWQHRLRLAAVFVTSPVPTWQRLLTAFTSGRPRVTSGGVSDSSATDSYPDAGSSDRSFPGPTGARLFECPLAVGGKKVPTR